MVWKGCKKKSIISLASFERTGFVISRKCSYMSRAVANVGYETFRFLDGAHLALTPSPSPSPVVDPEYEGDEAVVPSGMLEITSTASKVKPHTPLEVGLDSFSF